jgi:FkbM family methyltransferase
MNRTRELTFRVANAALIGTLGWLHRRFDVPTTYKLGRDGAAAMFEGSWFTYRPREFGCTGNIDYVPDAENATRHALFERIRGDEVFYDVGAHGGVYTITLARRFPNLQVHSFEPQPEELLANLALNGFPDDQVHPVAVGDKAGTVRMTTKQRSSNHVSDAGERSVRMVRLDDYAREKRLPAPDWIKIDIEGLELPALKGAAGLLRQSRPTIICEINRLHSRFGTTIAEFVGYMEGLGYEMHRLVDGELHAISDAGSFESLGYSADWNFWFLHRDR